MQTQALNDATTYHAPAGRAAPEELESEHNQVQNQDLLRDIMDSMPEIVVILNENRQVVAANQFFLDMLGVREEDVLGKRPGEAINCDNYKKGPDGCGTARHCMTCGAVNAILQSQQNHDRAGGECRVITAAGDALDLKVSASALDIKESKYTVLSVNDISDQKRRQVLERTFFHDVMNTAGGILGFLDILADDDHMNPASNEEYQTLVSLANQLVSEIQSQRDLLNAESGDLRLRIESINTADVLGNLNMLYSQHQVGQRRHIRLKDVCHCRIETDCRLLNRVLGNMLKNALEATSPNGTVTLSCVDAGGQVEFCVHNDAIMPTEVQLQIFQRSFSTKGADGRGIGTHSMKLLGEKYLGGRVSFTSRESEGTIFTFTLPKTPRQSGD